MQPTATLDAVRKSVTVKATPERAFEVFTKHRDAWWKIMDIYAMCVDGGDRG